MVQYLQFAEDVAAEVRRKLPRVEIVETTQYGGPAREFHIEEKGAAVQYGPEETTVSIWGDDYFIKVHLDDVGNATVDSATDTIVEFLEPKPPELPQI